MRTALWIFGVVIVAGVTLDALLAGAASGDAIYIKQSTAVTLTAPQKTAAANFANAEFPSAVLANVDVLNCAQGYDAGTSVYKNVWRCRLCDIRSANISAWLDLELSGRAKRGAIKTNNGTTVTYADCSEASPVVNQLLLKTFVELWAGTTLDLVTDLSVVRPDPSTPSRIDAQANVITTASPAVYTQDTAAIRLLGKVP